MNLKNTRQKLYYGVLMVCPVYRQSRKIIEGFTQSLATKITNNSYAHVYMHKYNHIFSCEDIDDVSAIVMTDLNVINRTLHVFSDEKHLGANTQAMYSYIFPRKNDVSYLPWLSNTAILYPLVFFAYSRPFTLIEAVAVPQFLCHQFPTSLHPQDLS